MKNKRIERIWKTGFKSSYILRLKHPIFNFNKVLNKRFGNVKTNNESDKHYAVIVYAINENQARKSACKNFNSNSLNKENCIWLNREETLCVRSTLENYVLWNSFRDLILEFN